MLGESSCDGGLGSTSRCPSEDWSNTSETNLRLSTTASYSNVASLVETYGIPLLSLSNQQ